MVNLLHIAEGWAKSMGILEVGPEVRRMSSARMKICAGCPNAKQSSILKFIKGNGHDLAAIYCELCGCPVNEKSLVKKETCPLGKWDIKQ